MIRVLASGAILAIWMVLSLVHCGGETPGSDGGAQDSPSGLCRWGGCSDGQYCDHSKGCRAQCKSDKDCSSAKQLCHKSTARCVDCVRDEDCGKDGLCRAYRCFKDLPCTSSKQCPSERVCDLEQGKCLECASDADCINKYTCRRGACIPPPPLCVSHKDCKAYGLVCDVKKARCVECEGDNDCEKGTHCQDKYCVRDVCEKGAVRCAPQGEAVEKCAQNGGAWGSPTPCGSDEFCAEGSCKKQACTPGETRCENNGIAKCNGRGAGYLPATPCGKDAYCSEGQCKAQACTPGKKLCSNNVVETCKADGSGYEQKPCGNQQFCDAGACVDWVCQPDEKGCDNNATRTCKKDGSGWLPSTDCGGDKYCEKGTCVPKACQPGEKLCAGDVAKVCNPDGKSYTDKTCATGEYCKNGACEKQQCKPNDLQCKDLNTAQRCKVDGSQWEDTTCATAEACYKGKCYKQVCTPNATTCSDGTTLQTCDSRGLNSTKKPCASGEYCDKGVCNKQACTPGTQECASATTSRTCNANGSSWNVTPCKTGEICEKAVCRSQICTPNATDCLDIRTLRTCDAKGLNWTSKSCGAKEYCEQGKCQTGSCPEGQSQSCYSGPSGTSGKGICQSGSQTCTKGQWSTCVGEVLPQTETCDQTDNNCDGNIDENNICPPTPTITSVTPSAWNNSCATEVEITGTGFSTKSSVIAHYGLYLTNARDTRYKLTYVSPTKLRFQMDAAQFSFAKQMDADIYVFNAPGVSSNIYKFRIYDLVSKTADVRLLTPGSGQADTQVSVRVYQHSGSSFYIGAKVELNGKAVPTTCAGSGAYCSYLEATLDLAGMSPGSAQITVVNPCGFRGKGGVFFITPPPTPILRHIAPSFARVGDKKTITLSGEHFSQGHELLWNGVKIPSTFVSSTQITAGPIDFTSYTPGNATVQVDNKNGTKTGILKFVILPKSQTVAIDSLSVTRFEAGKFYPNVIITGSGFSANSKIYFNGAVVQSTYNSATQITIPLLDLTQIQAGTYELYAKEGTQDSNRIAIVAVSSLTGGPTLSRISPSTAAAGSSFSINIYGENFCTASGTTCATPPKVKITGSGARDYSSSFTITRTYVRTGSSYVQGTLDASSMIPGTYQIALEHSSNSGTSSPVILALGTPAPPKITSFPSSVTVNTTPLLSLNGSGFTNGSQAMIGSLTLATTYVNASQLRVTVDATKLSVGSYSLIVRNPDAQRSEPRVFAVIGTQPAIVRLAPGPSYTEWGYSYIRVYGTYWQSSPTFLIDGKAFTGTLSNCRIYSGQSRESYCDLRPFSTAGMAAGLHTIQFQKGSYTSPTFPFTLTKGPPPSLHKLSHLEFRKAQGTNPPQLTLHGSNFASGAVLVMGQQRLALQYISETQLAIKFDMTQLSAGIYQVYVENPDKQKSDTRTLTILPLLHPTLRSTSQDFFTGTISRFYIYGDHLQTGLTFTINGTNTSYLTASTTSIQLRSFKEPTIPLQLQVALSNGLKSNTYSLLPRDKSLKTHRVRSTSGTLIFGGRSQTLEVRGRGFIASSSVEINGTAVATTYRSSTQLNVSYATPGVTKATDMTLKVIQAGTPSNEIKFTVVPAGRKLYVSSSSQNTFLHGANRWAAGAYNLHGASFTSSSKIFFNGKALKTKYVNSTRLLVDEALDLRFLPLGPHYFHVQDGTLRSNLYTIWIETQAERGLRPRITSTIPYWVQSNRQAFLKLFITGIKAEEALGYQVIVSSANLSKPLIVPLHAPFGVVLDTAGWTAGLYTLTLQNKISREMGPATGFNVIK